MNVGEVLTEAFDRLSDLVGHAVDGLTPDQLRWRPDEHANSIGWLIWHLARIQDNQVAELLGDPQEWTTGGWAPRFGLGPSRMDTGFGYRPAQVAAIHPESADVLVAYYAAVAKRTRPLLDHADPQDLDRIVDDSWDPPVTLGVRLVSTLSDNLQHVGQAAYVRGLLLKSRGD